MKSPFRNGKIELNESYFGARRVRGIRSRGANKIHVLDAQTWRQRNIEIVKNCSITELLPIIRVIKSIDAIILFKRLKNLRWACELRLQKALSGQIW